MKAKLVTPGIAAVTLLFGATTMGSAGNGKENIGQPGVASEVTRTVDVEMGDIFFKPKSINVKPGETLRFILRNEGSLVHEFNIDQAAAHAAHQAAYAARQKEKASLFQSGTRAPTGTGKMINDMGHSAPNSVLIEPGATKELIWTFNTSTGLQFACNRPGHYQFGMVGQFDLK
ncbi:plastocyanin/azurin family copper-binding protein [Pseudomonas chlororaphis]|uniref:cupredoxin domain-containing protein n=1 Tax=Pseudomonas chlororaphis TaxID=587753 RepID=UPI0023683998|nr:plastocyanin/azurin family copper-binding protein [Pseudomonas chlororaphis]WDG77672.1 plastocyanin/azurin family copper-binding protein [Pseudomonas chlororaphis]WDG83091.1 plastocyanin/azurin family copper-binding protein [Pseudomonas chlororaphis]